MSTDYSILDLPEVLSFVFYPRNDWTDLPAGASDHLVQVEAGVYISCRFYTATANGPSILFFHGNGEVACDYDGIAPLYQKMGLNLFVADYRGYGRSGGHPDISHLFSDSHMVFQYFKDTLRAGRFSGGVVVMGRSLGSYPAVELASSHQSELMGLIIESGFVSIARLLRNMGLALQLPGVELLEKAHLDKVRSIHLPALVIHGEQDFLVPFQEGQALFNGLGSTEKRLVPISGAGHNDIMLVGLEEYFTAIREFIDSGT